MNLCYSNKADSTNYIYFYLFYTVLMEKLVDLLNEYETKGKKRALPVWTLDKYGKIVNVGRPHITSQGYAVLICSKPYRFIEHLVKNDLIDFHKIKGHANLIKYWMSLDGWERPEIKEWVVLMLLSVSDDPLNLLISFLK